MTLATDKIVRITRFVSCAGAALLLQNLVEAVRRVQVGKMFSISQPDFIFTVALHPDKNNLTAGGFFEGKFHGEKLKPI